MTVVVEHIWSEWRAELKRFIQRRVSDESIVEDLLQEVFFKIHSGLHTLKDIRHLNGWVYRIARNTIIDHYRKRKLLDRLPETVPASESEKEDAGRVMEKLTPCIEAMVDALPEKYRQALRLTAYNGMTQKEMGEVLGLSVSGAKSRTQRAREKLKEMLTDCCRFELDVMGNVVDYEPRHRSPGD